MTELVVAAVSSEGASLLEFCLYLLCNCLAYLSLWLLLHFFIFITVDVFEGFQEEVLGGRTDEIHRLVNVFFTCVF